MAVLRTTTLLVALLCSAALFGFYFTMSVSIMPGLDLAEPYAAIIANQFIGRATQSSVFFVALLGTPLSLVIAIALLWSHENTRLWLMLALLGWISMMFATFFGNVPLNEILDELEVSSNDTNLRETWLAYSVDWQFWNWFRVLSSGLSVVALGRFTLIPDVYRI